MDCELHEVSENEWQHWRMLRLAALADAPDAFGSRLREWDDATEERWRERLLIPRSINLLAVDVSRDTAVGMASGVASGDRDDSAELISMWVAPAARGCGVADALIAEIAQWAIRSGLRTLTLAVMPGNTAALGTYRRNGFSHSEDRAARSTGNGENVMVKTLSPEHPGTE